GPLRDLAALGRDDLPHVHPDPRHPHGAPEADERLRAEGPDEALAVRGRELVRAPRARGPADPDLREREDPARLSLRRRLRRGADPRRRGALGGTRERLTRTAPPPRRPRGLRAPLEARAPRDALVRRY